MSRVVPRGFVGVWTYACVLIGFTAEVIGHL